VLPHLRDPEAELVFGRADFLQEDGNLRFAETGPVFLRYERRERRGETECRRYRIGGPGLSDTTGTLWADAALGHIVEFELPIADEPGFVDGRLRLLEVQKMTPAQWEAFKRSRLGE
jgi:hypothetical protein